MRFFYSRMIIMSMMMISVMMMIIMIIKKKVVVEEVGRHHAATPPFPFSALLCVSPLLLPPFAYKWRQMQRPRHMITTSARSHLLALPIPPFFSSFRFRRLQQISALDCAVLGRGRFLGRDGGGAGGGGGENGRRGGDQGVRGGARP